MNIVTARNDYSIDPNEQFYAYDRDAYDGPGSLIGFGATAEEAVEDLQQRVSEGV